MIICKDGTVRLNGGKVEVLAEATCVLHAVYERLVEHEGEEKAVEQLEELFGLAVMSADEIEEVIVTEEQKAEIEMLEQEVSRLPN